jgi:hypothetical protein
VSNGRLRPPIFVWREPRYAVTPIERQRPDAGETHILAMAKGGRTFELADMPNAGACGLGRTPADLGTRLPVGPSKPRVDCQACKADASMPSDASGLPCRDSPKNSFCDGMAQLR